MVLLAARRWRTAILLTAGVLVVVTPLLARNYRAAGDVSPLSSHGGLSFFIGNNPDSDGTHRTSDGTAPSMLAVRDDARQVAELAIGRALDDSEVSAHFYGQGWTWILGHPAAAARLFATKLAYVFNQSAATVGYSLTYYVRDEHNLLRYLPVGAWLLVPMGLVGFWVAAPVDPRQRTAFWLWTSVVPLYAVAVATFYVSSRLRLPLLVPLCVGAGAALDAAATALAHADRLARRCQRSACRTREDRATNVCRRRSAAWSSPFLRAGRLPSTTGVSRSEPAWRCGSSGRRDTPKLNRVRPRSSRDIRGPRVLHFRLGRAFLAKEQHEAAIRHFERATTLDPEPETAFGLGQALMAANRAKEAIPHLRRAFEARVRPDISGFELARAYAAAGDRAARGQDAAGCPACAGGRCGEAGAPSENSRWSCRRRDWPRPFCGKRSASSRGPSRTGNGLAWRSP